MEGGIQQHIYNVESKVLAIYIGFVFIKYVQKGMLYGNAEKNFFVIIIDTLFVTNIIPVSAAEKTETVKAESLTDVELEEYSQFIMDGDVDTGIQPKAPAQALTSLD